MFRKLDAVAPYPARLLPEPLLAGVHAARTSAIIALRIVEDVDLGKKVEEAVRAGQGGSAPTTAQTATTPGSEAAKV